MQLVKCNFSKRLRHYFCGVASLPGARVIVAVCVNTSAVLRNAVLCLIFPLFCGYVYVIANNGAPVADNLGITGNKRLSVFLFGGLEMF